jgi:cell division septum initiation protein DivIVA
MENKTDLDALDRAHAMYSTKRCELTWDERYLADNWPADIHNAYPAIAAELREARQEIAELRAELNERTMIAARAQESLRLAMAGVADRGAVWAAYGNADSARSWLDARDRRMKAKGAAKELRKMAQYLRNVSGDVKEDGHHEYDLWSGLASAANDCEARAAELEAAARKE